MFQQVTKNIKVSVKVSYNGISTHGNQNYHAFSYFITIKNNSKETIQLLERFWNIYDSLNDPEFVEGPGVIGQTPILLSNDEYSYTSNCFLLSTTGAMKGSYKMKKINTSEEFLVTIPTFQLTTPPTLN